MRVSNKPPRYPWWQLVLLGIAGAAESLVWPLRRMWRSEQPLDAYGLCHFTSVAGDALLAISLADSVFFSLPVGQAKTRVALYLLLTMVPLALAGPLLIPLLDRAGPRRAISFAAAAGRAVAALYAAPRVGTLVLFPAALVLLVLSKVHAITKNGLTTAYAPPEEGLMRANARLGRIAVGGRHHGGAARLPLPEDLGRERSDLPRRRRLRDLGRAQPAPPATRSVPRSKVPRRGRSARADPRAHRSGDRRGGDARRERVPALPAGDLAPRCGRAASWWFGVLAAAGVLGGFVADLFAPRLPTDTREEAVVVACVSAGAIGALLAFEVFGLPAADGLRVRRGRRDRSSAGWRSRA